MSLHDTVFVLGAKDPEMNLSENFMKLHGLEYVYASDSHGNRVSPGIAYAACRLTTPDKLPMRGDYGRVVYVECGGDEIDRKYLNYINDKVVIDHHHPGHPGYDKKPHEFLEGSSLGQLVSFVVSHMDLQHVFPVLSERSPEENVGVFYKHDDGWCINSRNHRYQVPEHYLFTAAADHCPSYAYRGYCHGVEKNQLLLHRFNQKSFFQNRPVDDIHVDTLLAISYLIKNATKMGSISFVDLTEGPGTLSELPEASAYTGIAVLSRVTDRGGREKEVLLNGTPDLIRYYMERWEKEKREFYGCPERGYAGAYL